MTKKLYKIPIDQREIHASMSHWAESKFHVTDNIGFVLFYDKKMKITDDFIRMHLTTMNRCEELVIAESKEQAIEIVSKDLEGISIGGESPKSKAQQIVVDAIEEIPLCPRMKMATEGDYKGYFMCHMLNKDGSQNEEYLQGCMFSQFDAPECCPIGYSTEKNEWYIAQSAN